jgi:hypothetical protein
MRSILLVCMFAGTFAFSAKPGAKTMPKIPSAGFLREAEKKHARVALLALPTLGAIAASTGANPVTWLSTQPVSTQAMFFATAGVLEGFTFARLAPNFSLKEGIVPGKFLDVKDVDERSDAIEDGAGRIAMLTTTAVMLYGILHG